MTSVAKLNILLDKTAGIDIIQYYTNGYNIKF